MSSMHAKFERQPVGQERQLAPRGSVFGWHENSAHAHSRQVNIHISFSNVFNDGMPYQLLHGHKLVSKRASMAGALVAAARAAAAAGWCVCGRAVCIDIERKTAAVHGTVP
jgi:hypothetical protein